MTTTTKVSLQDMLPADTWAPPGATPVDVSVVIPCLNEVQSIASCIDKALDAFRHIGIRGEAIVSDNGSTDGSTEISPQHGARVVHAQLKGYASALRNGAEEARREHINICNPHGRHDSSKIPRSF